MAKTRRIQTTWAKGELSPLLEGRPDLAPYAEGAKTLENWYLLRQGGIRRRPGTRFVSEVKNSDRDTVLIPFEYSVNDAYIIELGNLYMRFYRNGAPISNDVGRIDIASPYTEAEIRSVHYTQSADVLFLFHPDHPQYKLSRISNLTWVLAPIVYQPPPSFEADTYVSGAPTGVGEVPSDGGPESPSISVTYPADGMTFTLGTTLLIQAVASDDVGVVGVTFFFDDIQVGSEVTVPPWQISKLLDTVNVHTVKAVARDGLSNQTTSATILFSVYDPGGSGGGGDGGDGGGGGGGAGGGGGD